MPRHTRKRSPVSPGRPANENPIVEVVGSKVPPLDRRTPTVPQIYDHLRDLILKLELEPGAVISKDDVAQAFGVSAMPVREALRKLEEDGLVIIKPQSGTYVTTIDVQWAWEAQFLRIALEVEVIRKIAGRITDKQIGELEAILRRQHFEFEADNKEGFHIGDATFHQAMYEMAGVGRLWQKIATMRVHIDRLRAMHLPYAGQMTRVLTDHQLILDGLRAHDAELAEAALRKHLTGTLSFVETFRSQYPNYF